MSSTEYGLTQNGPNIKRLDTILEEMHADLSDRWGVNTRQNPSSFLNDLLTDMADKYAELWELGEQLYYAKYPSTAEGVNLDNAAQYGGSTREPAASSRYLIHCTGKEGTTLAAGTLISSTTNPATQLTLTDDKELTRASFNKAEIKIASLETDNVYTVAINGTVFSFTPTTANASDILNGIAAAITDTSFETSVDEENEILNLEAVELSSTNTLILSENLTTETITCVYSFSTVDTGDILLPDGVITNIVKADSGLQKVVNMCGYIAGRDTETDAEFRLSYADKIFNRSSMMLESIRSAILQNVQGVTSVAPYENYTNVTDAMGRPPHSIEIVVDGGDPEEIAQQILRKKAGGINTFGDTAVVLPGEYDEEITIRFNRPIKIYTWFHIGITLSKSEALPPNYVEILRKVILENTDTLSAGTDVVPQQFMSSLYKACSGISYIDIKLFATEDAAAKPSSYPDRSELITARQRVYTTEDMIEVEIDG